MSKVVRNKHLKIITLLGKMMDATYRLAENNRIEEIFLLLEESQASAIILGNHIEKIYGENTQTVLKLGEYCEALYQVCVKMEANDCSIEEFQFLRKYIDELSDIYIEEFPNKLEVVFMPYKASMWDSLESVWIAYKNSNKYDTYVMPIPYYDLNQEKSLKQRYYEGEMFPDYVPITSYEEYDLEERHPDIIFIHNPYDDGNVVTCIEPSFFSEKIKEYTDCLVYIPYYILPGPPRPNDEHFVLTKGVYYADVVFVQNEEVRDFYIKVLSKNMPQVKKTVWKQKIIAMGSPKTDKIINIDKNKLEIPDEWKHKIEGKKVIFFNTNVSMILKNPEHILENLERIFSIFRKHSDFVVIWREHPLTMSTLDAMCVEIKDGYIQLRNRFVEEEWGILDCTPDPHLAMALSDCYYGAGGSLSAVYPVTGKPLMVMDYLYPQRISVKEISLEEMLQTASARMLYAERNINSLDLFLNNIFKFEAQKEERIFKQSIRMNNLDGTVGKKIYEYINMRKEK